MSQPIAIPKSRSAASPASSYSSSASSGLYVPVHRRHLSDSSTSSEASTPATSVSSSPAKSCISLPPVANKPRVYTRDELFSIASSPFAKIPIPEALYSKFPAILNPELNQVERAIVMSNKPLNPNRYSRKRNPTNGNNNAGKKENNGTKHPNSNPNQSGTRNNKNGGAQAQGKDKQQQQHPRNQNRERSTSPALKLHSAPKAGISTTRPALQTVGGRW